MARLGSFGDDRIGFAPTELQRDVALVGVEVVRDGSCADQHHPGDGHRVGGEDLHLVAVASPRRRVGDGRSPAAEVPGLEDLDAELAVAQTGIGVEVGTSDPDGPVGHQQRRAVVATDHWAVRKYLPRRGCRIEQLRRRDTGRIAGADFEAAFDQDLAGRQDHRVRVLPDWVDVACRRVVEHRPGGCGPAGRRVGGVEDERCRAACLHDPRAVLVLRNERRQHRRGVLREPVVVDAFRRSPVTSSQSPESVYGCQRSSRPFVIGDTEMTDPSGSRCNRGYSYWRALTWSMFA